MKTAGMVLIAACLASACTGSEDSGCKKGLPESARAESSCTATAFRRWVGTSYADEVAGFECIAWEFADNEQLAVDLLNFDGACGAKWEGEAEIAADGTLNLRLGNPGCEVARCSGCPYDWSFTVQISEPTLSLPTTIAIDPCTSEENIQRYALGLPLDAEPSGIRCRYILWYRLANPHMMMGRGLFATPCTCAPSCAEDETDAGELCNEGLACVDRDQSGQAICLRTCSSDADCGVTGALTCQGGICRPGQLW